MNEVQYTYNLLSIFLALLFAVYLFFNKSKERSGNIFIGIFILYMGLECIDELLVQSSFYIKNTNFYMIIPILGLLLYPTFFFYIKSIAFKGFQLKWKDIVHVIPFMMMVIISMVEYYFRPNEVQLKIMTSKDEMPWFIGLIYIILRIQGLLYMVFSILIAVRFRKLVKENYSTLAKRNYKWILQLTFVFVYFALTTLIFNLSRFVFDIDSNTTYYISATFSLFFLIWVIYKGLSQPYLFNGVDSNIKLLREYIEEKQKNRESLKIELDSVKNQKIKSRLEDYVIKNEIYLNPSLTILDLAKGIDLTSMELSLFLNKQLNKNFFDFINEFRIEKAKKMLKSTNNKHLTVQEIFYSVGFNSKSSFNTAFKKYVGKTPTQYRREQEN